MMALVFRNLVSLGLLVLVACAANVASAQDINKQLTDEVATFEQEMKAAEEEHAAKVAEIRKKHLDSLQKLRTEATSKDDLDTAVAVREQADKVAKEDTAFAKTFDEPEGRAKLVNALSRAMWLTGDTGWNWTKPGLYFDPRGIVYPWGSNTDITDPKLVRWAAIGPRTIVLLHHERFIDVLEFNTNITEFRMLRCGQVPTKPDPKWASIKRRLVDPTKAEKE